MKTLYYVGSETDHGWIMISPAFQDRHSALVELYRLRQNYPGAAVCEEPYCVEMGVTFDCVAVH